MNATLLLLASTTMAAPLPDSAKVPEIYALLYVEPIATDKDHNVRRNELVKWIRVTRSKRPGEDWVETYKDVKIRYLSNTGVLQMWMDKGTPKEQVKALNKCAKRMEDLSRTIIQNDREFLQPNSKEFSKMSDAERTKLIEAIKKRMAITPTVRVIQQALVPGKK
jgi:hypothetical protein